MPANGLNELTIRISNKLVTTKSGYISGTAMATLKSPSISERRSPTEKATKRFDMDRIGMSANGLTELTIRISIKLVTTKSGYISGTAMATLKSPSISERRRLDRTAI